MTFIPQIIKRSDIVVAEGDYILWQQQIYNLLPPSMDYLVARIPDDYDFQETCAKLNHADSNDGTVYLTTPKDGLWVEIVFSRGDYFYRIAVSELLYEKLKAEPSIILQLKDEFEIEAGIYNDYTPQVFYDYANTQPPTYLMPPLYKQCYLAFMHVFDWLHDIKPQEEKE